MNPTIDQFFTPSSARSVKRQKPSSSPQDSMDDNEQVGMITRGQLLKDISELLDKKLVSLATKEDLQEVTDRVSILESENAALKSEVSLLKNHDKEVAAKLLDLEGRSRRNNLIFRGLKVESNTRDFKHLVQRFCSDKFGSANTLWVNRAHPLGKDRKVVIAHFPEDSDIDYIMSRVGDLKGTGCSVQRDYPREIRRRRACLSAVREEVERVAGSRFMPLKYDHLTINSCRFTWENGELRTGQGEDGAEKLNSLFKHDFSAFLDTLKQNYLQSPHVPKERGKPSTAPRGPEAARALGTAKSAAAVTTAKEVATATAAGTEAATGITAGTS